MATMNISLPDTLRDWVDSKVSGGAYATASDFMRALVRDQMERETKLATLRAEIQKGLDSGVSDRSFAEIAADIRRRAEARAAARDA